MASVDIGRYGKRIVQMLWDPEPKCDDNSPVWCLGYKHQMLKNLQHGGTVLVEEGLCEVTEPKANLDMGTPMSPGNRYEEVTSEHNDLSSKPEEGQQWPESFLDDLESRFWFTYRSGFPNIAKSTNPQASQSMNFSTRLRHQLVNSNGFTSDTGWGCMIRSGQCLLANALSIVRFGRDWTRGQASSEEKGLLSLFADDPRAPFSIHKFVEHGAAACGTQPGQWFGPSATAQCIEALSNSFPDVGLKIYVTTDAPNVYEDRLLTVAKAGTEHFHPTLLLFGTRLGIDRVTPTYREALKTVLQMPQSVGIAGGRPSSSHYFIGTQGSRLFYLDPHHTRPALPFHENSDKYTAEEVNSCHTRRLRQLHLDDMDPSMLIAFLFRNADEWDNWKRTVDATAVKVIFHIGTNATPAPGLGAERESALDEVETFDDNDTDEE